MKFIIKKLYKHILLSLSILILSTQITGATINACVGQPVTLNWNSVNCAGAPNFKGSSQIMLNAWNPNGPTGSVTRNVTKNHEGAIAIYCSASGGSISGDWYINGAGDIIANNVNLLQSVIQGTESVAVDTTKTWNGSACACPAGTFQDGDKCTAYKVNSLTASDCTILPGRSTCDSNVAWNTTKPMSENWIIRGTGPSATTPINTTNLNIGNQNTPIKNGKTDFTIDTLGKTPNISDPANAACKSGSAWDGSSCPIFVTGLKTEQTITTGSNAILSWKSNGNTCEIKDGSGAPTGITISSTNGDFSYTMNASAWGFLKNTGDYPFSVECYWKDTDGNGTPAKAGTILHVYKEPTASITDTDNNGVAEIKCTMDWTTATLKDKENNTILKSWTNNTGKDLIESYTIGSTKKLELSCKYKNLFEAIDTLNVADVDNLSLTVTVMPGTNATVHDTAFTGETKNIDTTSNNGDYVLKCESNGTISGCSPTSISNLTSDKYYTITSVKNGKTATVKVILRAAVIANPKAVLNTLTTTQVSGICYDSMTYELYIGGAMVSSGSSSPSPKVIIFTNPNMQGKTEQDVKLVCKTTGKPDGIANGKIVDASKAAATILKFAIYPSELACAGGKVTLSWEVKDSVGKNCHLTPQVTTKNLTPSQISVFENATQLSLNGASYISYSNNINGVQSTKNTVFEIENNTISKGSVSNITVGASTKFILTCGGSSTGVPESSRSVETKVVCRGQE